MTPTPASQSISDLKGDHLSIKMFSGVGDGVTDNYVAFQNALASIFLTLGSGTLFIPGGVYLILVPTDGFLEIPANVHLEGVGNRSEILWVDEDDSVKNLFHIVGNNVTISNLSLKGKLSFSPPAPDLPAQALDFIQVHTADNVLIDRVHFNAQKDAGYNTINGVQFVGDMTNFSMTGCTVEQCQYGTYKLVATTSVQRSVRICNNHFLRNWGDDVNFNSPGNLDGFFDCTVTGNTFYANQQTNRVAGFGVDIANIKNVTVSGNTFESYQREAIHVEISFFVSVWNNTFRDCATFAETFQLAVIHIIATTDTVSIGGNVIDGTNNTNDACAIDVQPGGVTSCNRAVITGNTIKSSATFSGMLGIFSGDVVMSDNILVGVGTVVSGAYSGGSNIGIDCTGSVHVSVTGNIIRGYGVGIGSLSTTSLIGDDETIANNVVSDCDNGIALIAAGDIVVTGNMVRNCVTPLSAGAGSLPAQTAVITSNSAIGCTNPMDIYSTFLGAHRIIKDNLDDLNYDLFLPLRTVRFTPASAGWHRILVGINYMGGRVMISGAWSVANIVTDITLQFNISAFGEPINRGAITQIAYGDFANGSAVTRARISAQSSGTNRDVYLDIYIPSVTNAEDLILWFYGPQIPVDPTNPPVFNPTVGASSTETLLLGRGLRTTPDGSVGWQKYGVVKAAGNWKVGDQTGVAASGTTSQEIVLATLPAGYIVEAVRIKTNSAFAGVTTAVASVGEGGTAGRFLIGPYNLRTAVSDTNFADSQPNSGATIAQNTLTATVITSGGNVNGITDGAAVDVWVKWSRLQ